MDSRGPTGFTLADLCALLYPVPDPVESLEQNERYHHRDLARLAEPELRRELERLRLRLLLEDDLPAWLLQRRMRLEHALGDARGGGRTR